MSDLLKNAKPIIFNTEMVKAILDGRKTQFRKVIKLNDNLLIPTGYIVASTDKKRNGCYSFGKNKECDLEYVKSKYKFGDILYVKETFTKWGKKILFKADEKMVGIKWKPSVHLKQKDARIFLKVTNVRVERLQDISFDDCLKEGVEHISPFFRAYGKKPLFDLEFECFKEEFWNPTAKDGYKYQDNPYVFVYDFERVK